MSERVNRRHMQQWFVTTCYRTVMAAHADITDVSRSAWDRDDRPTEVACAVDHLQGAGFALRIARSIPPVVGLPHVCYGAANGRRRHRPVYKLNQSEGSLLASSTSTNFCLGIGTSKLIDVNDNRVAQIVL